MGTAVLCGKLKFGFTIGRGTENNKWQVFNTESFCGTVSYFKILETS